MQTGLKTGEGDKGKQLYFYKSWPVAGNTIKETKA
jgi:hypothetical protein